MSDPLSAPPLFLGVDGGGTKTLAVVVDAAGQERGRGQAGGANYNTLGLDTALANLHAAVRTALTVARAAPPVTAAWVGLAGVDRATDRELLLPHLAPLARAVHLGNDAELALSALPSGVGVALIAGTGSIALGRDPSGATARAGGWGHILGDEGSGYDIGRRAVQAALRASDGRGPATSLLPRILARWDLPAAEALLSRVYPTGDKAVLAALAPLVLDAAADGDPAARTIIRRAAAELAAVACAVARVLAFPDGRVPLALGGALLVHAAPFREEVLRRLRRTLDLGPVVVVDQPALSAARAACDMAAEPLVHSGSSGL
jgi:N-acetylglucosamine kinase-like BadF-type ATPase